MSIYLLDRLPERTLTWTFLMDPNKRNGALLTGIDFEGNVYVVDEHYAENIPDSAHVKRYQEILARHRLTPTQVAFFADPGGAGAQAIINIAELGIFAQPVPKDAGSVKASIELIRRAAWVDPKHTHPMTGKPGAPYLYFLRTLKSQWTDDGVEYHESRLLWELRQYRQKKDAPPDTPVKEKDDVTDCLRYHFLVRPFAPAAAPKPDTELAKLDQLSRMEVERFATVEKDITRPRERRDEWMGD